MTERLDNEFAALVDGLVDELLPDATPEQKLRIEASFSACAQNLLARTEQMIVENAYTETVTDAMVNKRLYCD